MSQSRSDPYHAVPCPVDGCENTRLPNHTMCQSCWHRVRKATRHRVWHEYARCPDSSRHRAAIRAAIATAEVELCRIQEVHQP